MAPSNNPARAPRRSWRAGKPDITESRGSRTAKRLVVTSIALALAAVFAFTIWKIFFIRSAVHIYYLAMKYSVPGPPPAAFSDQDRERFDDLKKAVIVRDPIALPAETFGHPKGLQTLAGEIGTRGNDVLIFYLNAHIVSDGGTAYLLCNNYDPARDDGGDRIQLASFLDQLKQCSAKTKLLILDTGRIRSDVRIGMMVNEVPRLLREGTLAVSDPNLWILSANSDGEVSQVFYPDRRSIFLHFVIEGLAGKADQHGRGKNYGDQEVDLRELWEYVHDNVSSWVAKYGGGPETQTPSIIRGDGQAYDRPPDQSPVLTRLRILDRFVKKPAETNPKKEPEKSDSTQLYRRPNHFVQARYSFLANVLQENRDRSDPSNATASDGGREQPAQDSNPTAVGTEPKLKGPRSADPTIQKFLDAWDYRDKMEQRSAGRLTPIDYAPYQWRGSQEALIGRELQYLSGASPAKDLQDFGTTKSATDEGNQPIGPKPKPLLGGARGQMHSLAVAQLFQRTDGDGQEIKLFNDLNGQFAQLVDSSSEEFPNEFPEFVSRLTKIFNEAPGVRLASELNLVVRLAQKVQNDSSDRRWEKVQVALKTRQLAERAASAAEWCQPWVQSFVAEGDRERITAERTLFGTAGSADVSIQGLNRAAASYRIASQRADAIRRAYETKNDLTFYAPHLVRTSDLLQGVSISQMLRDLEQLTSFLEQPDAARYENIREVTVRLELQKSEIDGKLDRLAASLAKNPTGRENSFKIERLLSTPLLRAAARGKLLEGLLTPNSIATDAIQQFHAEESAAQRPLDWASIFRQARLELELARLAIRKSGGGESLTSGLESTLNAAAALLDQPEKSAADSKWTSIASFGTQLKKFYGSFAAVIQNSESKRDLDSLLARERLARAIDPRDIPAIRPALDRQNSVESIRHSQLYTLLAWHQSRLEQLRGVPADERKDIFEAAKLCNSLANLIPNQVSLPAPKEYQPVAALRFDAPDKLSLDEPAKLTVSVAALRRQGSMKATLKLEFNPTLIELDATPRLDNLTPDATGATIASLNIFPDEPKTFNFTAKAKAPRDERTQITARLIVGDEVEWEDRLVSMPEPQVVKLLITGPERTVEDRVRGYLIKPFPSHVHELRWELSSRKPAEVRVLMRALAEPLDDESRRSSEKSGIPPRGRDVPIKPDPEFIPIAPGQNVPIPFQADQEPGTITNGLVCILQEREPGSEATKPTRQTFYWIDFQPRHPREYLKPEIVRDSPRGEVRINIKSVGNMFPPGPAEVVLELPPGELSRVTKSKAKLNNPTAVDSLSIKVDPERTKPIRVRLSADGYPRAFVFDVNLIDNTISRPRGGIREIRITDPTNLTVFAPQDSIPIKLQVDLPDVARGPDPKVELSWKWQAGGGRPKPQFYYDERDINVTLDAAKEDGKTLIRPEARDFEFELPTIGHSKDQVEFTASLGDPKLPDRPYQTVILVFDDSAPEFRLLDGPNEIEKGAPLNIRVLVSNENRVETVQLALSRRRFDPEEFEKDPEKFDKLEPKKNAEPDTGRFIATFETDKLETGETGVTYTLIARARYDYLDKWSYSSKPFRVIPKRPQTAVAAATITGTATVYEMVHPGTKIILTPKDNETANKLGMPSLSIMTDNGKFSFPNVPFGTYVIKGEVRVGADYYRDKGKEVIVKTPTPPPVKLELKS